MHLCDCLTSGWLFTCHLTLLAGVILVFDTLSYLGLCMSIVHLVTLGLLDPQQLVSYFSPGCLMLVAYALYSQFHPLLVLKSIPLRNMSLVSHVNHGCLYACFAFQLGNTCLRHGSIGFAYSLTLSPKRDMQ